MRRHASSVFVLLVVAALLCGGWAWETVSAQDAAKQLPSLADGRHELKGGESHSYLLKVAAGQFL